MEPACIGNNHRMEPKNARTAAASAAVVAGGAIVAGKVVRDAVSERSDRQRARRFRLEPGETVRSGIGRIARGQLDLAIALIEGEEGRGPEAIHDARKSLKRVRAVLRLCRDRLGEERFRQENTILRDAGRSMSGARDARVLVETLDRIREPIAADLTDGTWASFRDALENEAEADGTGGEEANLATALIGVRERVAVWSLPDDSGPDALADGFRRVYAKGRRALRRAERHPTDEHLHELRKRTKDVWHCGQVLQPVCPKRVKKLRRRAHQLADLLGDDHDLAVLLERAEQASELFGQSELELLRTLIARRRRRLQRDALAKGAKVYRRKPRKVLRRLALA